MNCFAQVCTRHLLRLIKQVDRGSWFNQSEERKLIDLIVDNYASFFGRNTVVELTAKIALYNHLSVLLMKPSASAFGL